MKLEKKLFYWLISSVLFVQAYSQKIIFREPMPDKYTFYYLDDNLRQARLEEAPWRFDSQETRTELVFPVDNNGVFEKFKMFRTRYMEDGLAAKYPQLATYVGKSNKGKVLYLTVTPYTVTGVVLKPSAPTYLVKQYDNMRWIGFSRTDQPQDEPFLCETDTPGVDASSGNAGRPAFNDGVLRKYRYAVAATGEFSQYHLNRLNIPPSATESTKKTAVVGEILTAVARINSVYERDFAISLRLVDSNDNIIFLDPNNDPYDNNTTNMASLLYNNQTTVDNYIGNANYDVSQVWCQGPLQGLALLKVVCDNLSKAKSAARGDYPESDRFIITVASHELGHEFGAKHVFYNNCGGNRSDDHAVEPGSGTTIMAYAGICPPNIQYYTDDRFNAISISDFFSSLFDTGSCSQNISINNSAPVVNAGLDKYIPKETAFMLMVDAVDADGDSLTYTWDELDIPTHNYSTPPQPTWTTGPMFRPYPARPENYRYFPNLDSLLNNRPQLSTRWEVLPSVSRLLKFRVTVRDNNEEGGQIGYDNITLGVDSTAGPFRLTSQTSLENWHAGDRVDITWDVAGTDGGHINCQTLDLLLAPDGRHFTDTLAAGIPNTGSYTLTVPQGYDFPRGRIMLKAVNNYFLSISKGKIMIGNYREICNQIFTSSPELSIPDNNPDGISDTIYLNVNKLISDVNVGVNISHTYVGDLKILLVAPDGTEVKLWDNTCSNEDNLNVIFDDEGDSIECANLTGHIKPVNSLSVLDDKYSLGPWVLKVSDNAQSDTGTLHDWSLDFCFIEPVSVISENILSNVEVYPNPVKSTLHIHVGDMTKGKTKITLYDMNGRILFAKVFENKNDFDIPLLNFSTGNYILHIDRNNKVFRTIIIKK